MSDGMKCRHERYEVRDDARATDEIAQHILDDYGTPLLRLGMMMLGRRMDAEDAVSETLLRYLQKRPEFQNPAHEKSWLYTVMANVCRDMLRKRRRLVYLSDTELSEQAQEPEDRSVLDALARLPEKYRTVLYLCYVEGYKSHEVGAMLGVHAGTVRKRLQYGRQLLKIEYEQE